MTRRTLRLNGLHKELELGRVVSVDSPNPFIYIEKMKDGKWRLTFDKQTIEDIQQLTSIEMIRDNDDTC
jgi:hypothetical protein